MNEADTRAQHIDPALAAAGWGVVPGSKILREYQITLGRLEGHGRRSMALKADYVLVYKNHKLAVIEAKAWDKPLTEGVQQAKDYAGKLTLRFAYSSNGQGIYAIDMESGQEGEVAQYPTPEELWQGTFARQDYWRDRFAEVPLDTRGGSWTSRYYQDIAVDRALEAITARRTRILLTLATGTGKTAIAFQIAWKLFKTRWNLQWDGERQPRILFLADRNILANQAYNAFSAFPEDALVRITPEDIRKKGKVPRNGAVFFTIFQTFMCEKDKDGTPEPFFGDYPPDFFDFIIIDECHRGGASDESSWRAIMDYFAPAVQLGLTATPKRTDNVDTYAYFGDPVYTYSLKEGINDGFLTPFRVKQISTTLDEYIYVPDDFVLEGEVEPSKVYKEPDFNRVIEIREREHHRVQTFLDMIDPHEKTLVFCASQDHALAVRDLINQAKAGGDPSYCVRVTANDGKLGEQFLRDYQDNEKTIPTILTTSHKLSTGVDARNVRNIVLMRPIRSMIEFKQIIGRGTRLYEGKDYFTIYDFVKAHHHFNDPEWDGEPVEPEAGYPKPDAAGKPAKEPEGAKPDPDSEPTARPTKLRVKLADGKERQIQHMVATSFWSADGRPMSSAQFLESLFGLLPELFRDEDELRRIWSEVDTRRALLGQLTDRGFGPEQLEQMQQIIAAENCDLFDVLSYVAFAIPPRTREDRASQAQVALQGQLSDKQRAFLDFVLGQYRREGVGQLDDQRLPLLLQLKYKAVADAIQELGPTPAIRKFFLDFQKFLYIKKVA
ncbi:MAG: DEAD/DEAH box helicase family protein [bacterium]|nr:DEAD/DEAH box helicase family protein [bacterium]